jgi:hypothetical protein
MNTHGDGTDPQGIGGKIGISWGFYGDKLTMWKSHGFPFGT